MRRVGLFGWIVCLGLGCGPSSTTNDAILEGTFYATVQGGTVSMTIESTSNGHYKGAIHDGNFTYTITGQLVDGELQGTAEDSTQGISFDIKSTSGEDTLVLSMTMTHPAPTKAFPLYFTKNLPMSANGRTSAPPVDNNASSGKLKRVLDPAVVGTWEKQESNHSGNVTNLGGMSSSELMTFHANGTMSSGPSTLQLNDTNLLKQSVDSEIRYLPGVLWFTEGDQLWLRITIQGKTEETKLGNYEVDKAGMLITSDDGIVLKLNKKD